jgi:hypothetical protein
MSNYLNFDCKKCGRHRVENNGICEKCNFDNTHNEFAQPVLECVEYGAGTCRNEILIESLRQELVSKDETIRRLKENAEALYYSILHQEFGETEYQSQAVDAHRALMKELECSCKNGRNPDCRIHGVNEFDEHKDLYSLP